ncbi:MAG: RDD family protein [Acidobacteriia bacterium]|nr:RDD family protein [Terriglobia bacterium]
MFCPNCGTPLEDDSAFCPGCGARMPAGSAAVPTGPGPSAVAPVPAAAAGYPLAPVMDYATWGSRAIGYLVDAVLVGGAAAVLYLVLGGLLASLAGSVSQDAAVSVCCVSILIFPLATLLVGLYNRVYLVSRRGYSIGQGLVKVKVVDGYGQLLTQGTAFIRLLVQAGMGLVPFLPLLDLLWPLWDERRQTLHDKAVSCYVINNPQGA